MADSNMAKNPAGKTPEERQLERRLGGFKVLTRLGVAALILDILANSIMYIRDGNWQDLVVAIGQLFSMALLGLVIWLVNQRRLDTAGYVALAALFSGLGLGSLLHAGLVWPLGISGFLLMLLIGSMVLPQRKAAWLIGAGLFAIYTVLVDRFSPFDRSDVQAAGTFSLFIVILVAMLVVVGAWQFIRLLRFGTIRNRLLVVFVALVLLPALAIGAVSSIFGAQRSLDQTRFQLESVATLKEAEIRYWADGLTADLALAMPAVDQITFYELLISEPTGADSALYRNTYDREVRRYASVIQQGQQFDEIFLLSLDGVVRLSTSVSQTGRNQFGYDFFNGGLLDYYVSPPYFDATLAKVTIVAAAPLKNEQGETIAVLAGRANLDRLNLIMLERAGLGETGETYLVRIRDQQLLTASRHADQGYSIGTYLTTSDGVIQAVANRASGSGTYENYNYTTVIGAYRYMEDLGLLLMSEQEQSEALRPVVQTVLVNAGVMLGAILVAVTLGLFVTNLITTPIANLAQTAEKIAGGQYDLQAEAGQEDEIGALSNSFNAMTARLRETLAGLEQQVAERTAALAARSAYLQASVDVSRAVVSVLDPDQLIQQVVNLIRDRFGLYYVGLFLVDEAQEYAVLQAGTGAAGKAMLARNHRIRVGAGMIGWCVANEKPRIALRAEMDDARLKNPDLPDTRSEAAIPLRSRGRVIGALTVQSDQFDAFDDATIAVFETMADQVAVAMDNARLFRESQQSLDSLNRAYGQITREDWYRLLQTRGDLGFSSFANGEITLETAWPPELERAVLEGETVEAHLPEGAYATSIGVPIKVRDTVIGVIGGYKSGQMTEWSEAEKVFLQEVADELSVALESARSYQQVQLAAQREQLVGEVTSAMRQSLDVDTVLRTAAQQIRRALNLSSVEVRLAADDEEELSEDGDGEVSEPVPEPSPPPAPDDAQPADARAGEESEPAQDPTTAPDEAGSPEVDGRPA